MTTTESISTGKGLRRLATLTRQRAKALDQAQELVQERARLVADLKAAGVPLRILAETCQVSRQALERQLAELNH